MASESVQRARAGLFDSNAEEPLSDQELRRLHLTADLELKADASALAAMPCIERRSWWRTFSNATRNG